MKYILSIIAAVIILLVVLIALTSERSKDSQAELGSTQVQSEYTLPKEGLTFSYPGGEEGYVILELTEGLGEPKPVRALRLLPASDYLDEQSRVAGEGSPAWLITVYQNDQMLQPANWAEKNPLISNISLALGSLTETTVGGANAVTYRTDGLYPAQVYVVAHASLIYVVNVSFMDEQSRTYVDYKAWIDSFTFSPIEPVSAPMTGKLNPKVVCESALMYTTFTDGEAADAFVADCIAGKHPEVFERYIQDSGLDGATI
jgi:hypothetical protein